MEPQPEHLPLQADSNATQCLQCGSTDVVPDYPNPLCANCRTSLIKYPVPLWVKAFGGFVLVVFLYALINLPGNFKAGIELARAEKAEKAKNYLTEQAELEKVLAFVPNSVESSAHMLIAAYYNEDLNAFSKAYKSVEGRKLDNEELMSNAEMAINQMTLCLPNDTINALLSKYKNVTANVPDTVYNHYIVLHPDDIYARLIYATKYFTDSTYKKCDALLSVTLKAEPDYLPALEEKSIVKRELHQLDSSLYYCDLLLHINHQSLMGLSSKARTLMKMGNVKQGLQIARQCEVLGRNFYYNMATLAIGYHLDKRFKERDAILQQARQDTALNVAMSYAKDVIDGKVKFF